MPGMSSSPITTSNSIIVNAFQSSLLHQLLLVLVVLAVLALAWNALRAAQLRRAVAAHAAGAPADEALEEALPPEPIARRVLRIGFGLIWVFDGILQAQAAMPIGLGNQVLAAGASSSPHWVQSVVNTAVTIWNNHPITLAVASVWIQVGIGIWMLVAPRGRWSEAGGLVSVGWGLVVWVFGEAFGQIFAPGLSFLFGAPGAVLFYCLAGALVAAPERIWLRASTGAWLCRGLGGFLCGMALLQAWPGRGFWQGDVAHQAAGDLTSMVSQMATTPQPSPISSVVAAFGRFTGSDAVVVNLVAVVVLAVVGLAFVSARPRLVRPALYLGVAFCLADWVLVEDFGFFGGVGTDPNNMVPFALCLVAAYLALVRPATAVAPVPASSSAHAWIARLRSSPTYTFRTLAAAAAVVVVLLGAAPAAVASTNPNADAIITTALHGSAPTSLDTPAYRFDLVDEQGRPVSLASLHGRAVALTFLDPVCTSDCPVIAQEFRLADEQLGADARRVEFVAVDANPEYRGVFFTQAFDRQEHLGSVSNWHFLTGSLTALKAVWNAYAIQVSVLPGGAMVDHDEVAYVISPEGRIRYVQSADPGPATSTTRSSFAGVLDGELRAVLGS